MSRFDELYAGVMKFEKGYDPYDQGYPAYGGINKGYQPQWPGWKELDKRAQAGQLKQGAFFPELEPLVIAFYQSFWAPVKVDKINHLAIAQLLVDMKTAHGRWKSIVLAAFKNITIDKSNFSKLPLVYTDEMINWINANPATAYMAIAKKRLEYVQSIKLQDERDRKGVINRAKIYINRAIEFAKTNPGTTAAIGTGSLLLFFF